MSIKKKKSGYEQETKIYYKLGEKYRGHIVMIINDRIFATKNPSTVKRYVERIEKKYHKTPLIAVIPKADTLILVL
jgi:hypothetical protein